MTRITDLDGIEVEHLFGDKAGPLVKIRAMHGDGVSVGQVDPESARKLAMDLLTAAARADYEGDYVLGALEADIPQDLIGPTIHLIRRGEVVRETTKIDGMTGPDEEG